MRETENKTLPKRIGRIAARQARSAGLVGLLLVLAGQGAMAQSDNPFRRLFGLEPKQEEQAQPDEQAAPDPQPNGAPAQRPAAQTPAAPRMTAPTPPRRPATAATPSASAEPAKPKADERKAEDRKTGRTAPTPFGTVFRPLGSTEFVPFSQPEPMHLQPKPLPGKAREPAVPAAAETAPPRPEPQPPVTPAQSAVPTDTTAPAEQNTAGQSETQPVQAEASRLVNVPLPPPAPKRPVENVAAPGPAPSPGVNTVPPPAVLPPVSTLTDRQIIERANRYFNTTDTLQAAFTQLAGGSQRTTGTLYLERPGRIRFAYNPPSTMEIISDGKNVAIRDSKLNTSDVYSINQTPLKFLLRDPINLSTDLKVVEIERDPTSIQITLEDSSTIGGKAQITLFFDPQMNNLTRWQILDAQGFLTTVILSQIKRVKRDG